MAFTFKQARAFGAAVKEGMAWTTKEGGKVVGTPKGQYVLKTTAKKVYKIYKDKGLGGVLKEGPKVATDISMKAWLKKPPLDFKKSYAKYVKDFTFKHGTDEAVHKAKKVKLLSMAEWAESKVPGIHYKGDLPKFDKMGGFVGQRLSRRVWRKVAAGSAFAGAGIAAIGFATDKTAGSGYFEGPKGIRVKDSANRCAPTTRRAGGGHWSAGGTVKAPRGISATAGWNVGIGHAEKVGLAHQLGGHASIATPWFKTGIKGEEQHAFGLKSRSRRVAAIRRATFGTEQHLGVSKKMNKSQKAKDTLYH